MTKPYCTALYQSSFAGLFEHKMGNNLICLDPYRCSRFLRARKFNLVQAKRMITQCLSWRHQVEGVGIDDLYREVDPFDIPQKEHVFKYWPMYYHRVCPLAFSPFPLVHLED